MDVLKAKAEVVLAGRELVEKGLVARTWGNVSCRIDEKRFAITPSGIGYDRLTEDDIVVVEIDTLAYKGSLKPSSEKGIHAAAYRHSPEAGFVIHTHQTCATVMGVAGFTSLSPTEAETEALGGSITLASYGLPSTKKLHKNVDAALVSPSSAVLMARHGAILCGADRQQAFERAVLLEDVCRRAMPQDEEPFTGEPAVTSRRLPNGGFELTEGDTITVFETKPSPGRPVELLHDAIYFNFPEFDHIAQFSSPAVSAVTEAAKAMPAVLDDFAQMVGSNVKVEKPLTGTTAREGAHVAARRLHGRNAVCVRGIGVLCCAKEAADCDALAALVEKNALAILSAQRFGPIKPLSFFDRNLMRLVYKLQYSKKK